MNRRTALAQMGALGAAGLAGCISSGDNGEAQPSETDTSTATATATSTETKTATPTPTPMPPTLEETTIEVQHNDCGQQRNEAAVSFENEDVVVEGTIWAPDPSRTATVVEASYDTGTDELTVTIGLIRNEDSGTVPQCIAEIEYRTTAAFSSGLPGTVTVTHENNDETNTVTTAQQ